MEARAPFRLRREHSDPNRVACDASRCPDEYGVQLMPKATYGFFQQPVRVCARHHVMLYNAWVAKSEGRPIAVEEEAA